MDGQGKTVRRPLSQRNEPCLVTCEGYLWASPAVSTSLGLLPSLGAPSTACLLPKRPATYLLSQWVFTIIQQGRVFTGNQQTKEMRLSKVETSQGHPARSGWAGVQTQGSSLLLRGTASCLPPPGTWAVLTASLTPIQAVEQVSDRLWALVCASMKWGDSTPLPGQGQEWMRGDRWMRLRAHPTSFPEWGESFTNGQEGPGAWSLWRTDVKMSPQFHLPELLANVWAWGAGRHSGLVSAVTALSLTLSFSAAGSTNCRNQELAHRCDWDERGERGETGSVCTDAGSAAGQKG